MLRRVLLAAPALVLANPAVAQNGAALRLIVPNSPGTGTDQVGRLLAPQFQARLSAASVVVENRSGASGVIGADLVAKARPDGTTLLLAAAAHAINASMVPNLPYDVRRDFAPVSLIAMLPTLLVVSPNFPARNFAEFVAYARAHPGRITYGSVGAASTQDLLLWRLISAGQLCRMCRPSQNSACRNYKHRVGLACSPRLQRLRHSSSDMPPWCGSRSRSRRYAPGYWRMVDYR
jgi:tripartite-type tricarboxylate transporter receptor subunit TctC